MPLDLPSLYVPIVARPGDVRQTAWTLAEAGEEEGTLVYASFDADSPGNDPFDLEFSLIMQPDFDRATTRELTVIAAMSMGEAIAAAVSPMVSLRYGWPGQIRLNDQASADCYLRISADDNPHPKWTIIDVRGIVANLSEPLPDYTSVSALAEAAPEPLDLVEAFCRNFLSLVNRWADDGFNTVSKPWRYRVDCHENEHIHLKTTDGDIAGQILEIGDDGSLHVQTNSEVRKICLAQAIFGESTVFDRRIDIA